MEVHSDLFLERARERHEESEVEEIEEGADEDLWDDGFGDDSNAIEGSVEDTAQKIQKRRVTYGQRN